MSQLDHIKDIAKYGLENDQDKLLYALNELIEHSKKSNKVNFAIQLQSILRDSVQQQRTNRLSVVGSLKHQLKQDGELDEFIIEKLTSDYRLEDIISDAATKEKLDFFIAEHRKIELLRKLHLPVSNKLLLHGPSGCGKTLAAYVLAGELNKMMIVVNLGSIVSSRLGETSKNLSRIFKRAATESCVLFIDEFDSLGKVRDYSQDHGEMKRVVNTLLQLFDYLPQDTILVTATNQKEMLDEALLRRFDLAIDFELPTKQKIKELIDKTLSNTNFKFNNTKIVTKCIDSAIGLSYYSVQKTLINSIKKSIFKTSEKEVVNFNIDAAEWRNLIQQERLQVGTKL